MAEFYDDPKTGKLHFRAPAGGTGGGVTSAIEVPATEAHLAAHPREHAAYINAKRAAAPKEETVTDLVPAKTDKVLSEQTVPHGTKTE